MPSAVNVKTKITKKISLNIPIISAAMDTVTEARTAIAMAQEGGLGVIHKNMSIVDQSDQIQKVKKYEGGMIIEPHTISPQSTGKQALDIMTSKNFTGLPVTEKDGVLLGIITMRDLRYEKNLHYKVSKLMTQKVDLKVVEAGTSPNEVNRLVKQFDSVQKMTQQMSGVGGKVKAAREMAKIGMPGMGGGGIPGLGSGKGSTKTSSVKSGFKQRKKKRR